MPKPPAKIVIEFQSSPDPKTGCNFCVSLRFRRTRPFQSSPDPKTGCNFSMRDFGLDPLVSILTRSEDRVQRTRRRCLPALQRCFNPHPIRRPGATGVRLESSESVMVFQSSPDPKTGCNAHHDLHAAGRYRVSILTRSEDRVQHFNVGFEQAVVVVSILTRSEDRVQRSNFLVGG